MPRTYTFSMSGFDVISPGLRFAGDFCEPGLLWLDPAGGRAACPIVSLIS